jgi:amino acid adenylation domain-containing protein
MSAAVAETTTLAAAKQALLEKRLQALKTGGTTQPRIPRVSREEPLPLSFAQERLWFLDQLQHGNPAYNLVDAWRLKGPVQIELLEQAFNEVAQRHESLRTGFSHGTDAHPRQIVRPATNLQIARKDLRDVPVEQREATLQRLASDEARNPFDLTKDILLRVTLFSVGEIEHVLLVTMHHIISDAWSLGVLYNEVNHVYASLAAGRPARLPEVPVQYADFASWQRQLLAGDALNKEIDFWKGQLSGMSPLDLPLDRVRPAQQTFLGALETLSLPEELARELKALSRREGVTLFMTLLAAFKTLLHRYTQQSDLAVGTPVSGRTQCDTENLIGFFVNTLVLRTDVSGDPTFQELLQRVRQVVLDGDAHKQLPFERVVTELQPERSAGTSPLFQVMFIVQGPPNPPLQLPGVKGEQIQIDNGTSKFDLSLVIFEGPGTLTAAFEYNTDLFERARVRRMLRQFTTLLHDIVARPETRLSRLRLLSEEEREQLVVGWNRTALEYPKDLTWVQLFEAQVARTPEATALVLGDERLSYADLNGRVNQLAHHLRRLGVGPESLVGICAERSIAMVVGILAVLKSGAAYVSMDPLYPAERLAYMLDDAKASVLLTQSSIQRQWPENTKVLYFDKLNVASEPTADPQPLSKPENLSHVIYTSGSTGQPKGVALEHRSLNALAHWAKSIYTPEELDGVLAGTSICFDLSVFELLVPLCWGGKVILAKNVLELPQIKEPVRLINTVPSAITELLRLKAIPPTVQVVNLAGEPLRQSLVDQLYEVGTVKKVYDLYGPTEDTVYSTCALREKGGRNTIGRPLANKQVYILDEQMEPVPVGVVGQLYIGGDGLARGYLNRPELTAERFISNPWSGRVYKTGDLARYQGDGQIEFLGRADHQVKIRGFRIELGEVEAQLRTHAQVREAVVVAREDGGEKRLVGYVVADANVTANELKDHVRKRLPEYMVPSAVVLLEKLPLTPNGKVDRNALPAPEASSAENREFVAPQTDIEQLLAEIWSEVLGVKAISIHDNFFELGGHSLMVTKLISRLRGSIQVELPMASVFEAPTIAELALVVEDILIQEMDGTGDDQAEKMDHVAALN